MKNISLYFMGIILLLSCNKSENEETIADTDLVFNISESETSSDLDFGSVISIASEQSIYYGDITNDGGNNVVISPFASNVIGCGTVTLPNSPDFPRVYIVNYDNAFCNGLRRNGQLVITYSDYVLKPGSTITVVRNNYQINGRKVEGTVTYLNQTVNPNQPRWKRTLVNGKITALNGTIFTSRGTSVVTQTAGFNTPILSDNVYSISDGRKVTIRPTGDSVVSTILEPLTKKYTCLHISKGKLKIDGSIYATGTLDYGKDSCDSKAVFTLDNGGSYEINLQ